MAIHVFTDTFIECTKPVCHKCGTEVDDMGIESDYMTKEKVFWVRCHGDLETFRVPHDFDILSLKKGIAFNSNLLSNTKLLE